MTFKYYDDELGELEIEIEGTVFKTDIEDNSPLGYHYEYGVHNLQCLIYKGMEEIKPENISKDTLNDIFEKAQEYLLDKQGE